MIEALLWSAISLLPMPAGNPPAKPAAAIAISTATPVVTRGSARIVTVTLTNNSKRALDTSASWSDATHVDPNWIFDVRDESGKPVPRRTYKLTVPPFGSVIFSGVGPGRSAVENVDLTWLYVFDKPGKYRIRVSRKLP